MAVERIDIEERTAWLEMRRQVVSASEVALLLGVGNPHREINSLAALFADKTGLRPPPPENATMRRGRRKEELVFMELADERPHWDIAYPARIYLVDKSRHIGATPDGFAVRPDKPGPGVVEAKTVARTIFRTQWLVSEDDDVAHGEAEVPEYYRLQTLQTMMLAGSQWGVLAVLVTGEFADEFRLFEIARNAEVEDRIIEKVAHFWNDHMAVGVMPDYDPQRDQALIRAMYPVDAGSIVDLSTNNMVAELVSRWELAAIDRKSCEADEDANKAALQMLLGEHTWAMLPDGRVLQWKVEPRDGYKVAPKRPRILRLRKGLPRGAHFEPREGANERTTTDQ